MERKPKLEIEELEERIAPAKLFVIGIEVLSEIPDPAVAPLTAAEELAGPVNVV